MTTIKQELKQIENKFTDIDYQREKDKAWEKYNNTIEPALLKRADCANLWHETWIDLEESWFEKWMQTFRYMSDNEIVEACAKYLIKRERFYNILLILASVLIILTIL